MLSIATVFIFSGTGCEIKNKSNASSVRSDGEIDFAGISDIKERKQAFFNYLAPIVIKRNQEILRDRKRLSDYISEYKEGGKLSSRDQHWILDKARSYKVFHDQSAVQVLDEENTAQILAELKLRIDVVPVAMALAQAAKESGWGTSRFAQDANNFYGQRCYRPGCGIVPIGRKENQKFEVRKFASPVDSVRSYIKNLNSLWAYNDFRRIRATMRADGKPLTGISLVKELGKYSERGESYIRDIVSLIEYNRHMIDRAM